MGARGPEDDERAATARPAAAAAQAGQHAAPAGAAGAAPGGGGGQEGRGSGARSPEPPAEFVDPISEEIMVDPVLLLETGQTYERASIQQWFATCPAGRCLDPLTGTVLKSTELVPNFALKGLISKWAESHRIGDIPEYSRTHSEGLRRLATQLGRVQLSPPRASPLSAPAAAAGGGGDAAAAAAGPANAPGGAGRAGGDGGAGAEPAATGHAAYPALYGAPPSQPVQPRPGLPPAPGTTGPLARLSASLPGPAPPPGPKPTQQLNSIGMGGLVGGGGAAGAITSTRPAGAPPAASPPSPAMAGGATLGALHPAPPEAGGLYPGPGRPMRTTQDKLRDVEASLQALQPGQLVSGAKGAAAYHAWTLMQLANEKECQSRMLQGQVVPLAVYLMGQPGLDDAKPSLAGLLQRLSVTGPAVASDILTAGGVHALAMLAASEDRQRRVAAVLALYYMGWVGEQVRWTAASSLAQQAAQQQLPANPLFALWRFWETLPPRAQPQPQPPPPPEDWELVPGPDGTTAASPSPPPAPPPASVPAPQVPLEAQEEWEALAYITHMLSGASGPQAAQQLQQLDVRGSGLPQVLTHVATSPASSEAAQYAALAALHALCRGGPAANRGVLLAPLVDMLGGGDWDMAARAAGALWELSYDEGFGNNFLLLQALHATPQFIPSLTTALACPHPPLRKAAAGLLGCVLFDGAGFASSGSAAAAVDSQRYMIVDGWRQVLLSPGSPTLRHLLEAAQDAASDAQHAALALTAVANLAAARGTAAAYDPHLSPIAVHQPKPSALDKLSARLQTKLHGRGGAGGSPDGPEAPRPPAPGPRGAILSHDRAVPTLLQLVVSPEGAYPGSGAWGSGSFASLSPPDTPGSAASHSSAAAAFSFTPIGHLGRGGSAATAAALAADPQGVARLVLPPALLALNNLVTEAAGREQVRAWAKAHGRQAQLHSALNAAMGNRQLPQQVQELARRLLHELSAVPGPLQRALACRAVPPPPRAAAYPTP